MNDVNDQRWFVPDWDNIRHYSPAWDEIKGKAELYQTARRKDNGSFVRLEGIVHDHPDFLEPVFITTQGSASSASSIRRPELFTTSQLCDFCL